MGTSESSGAEAGVGVIEAFMTEDHARIDASLRAAERGDGTVDEAAYVAFRGALLRHIGMEEKVLLPFARERRGGVALDFAARLRADHSRIAKLLVRSPSRALFDALRAELSRHNEIEEGPAGLYAVCDALAGSRGSEIVARLAAQPAVPLAKYYDGPLHGAH